MEGDRDLNVGRQKRELHGLTELDAGGDGRTESDWKTANGGRSGGRRRRLTQ